jgi:hypothetical protein
MSAKVYGVRVEYSSSRTSYQAGQKKCSMGMQFAPTQAVYMLQLTLKSTANSTGHVLAAGCSSVCSIE